MAKIQLKSDNITPFGGLYPIFNLFSQSGVRAEIDSFLGNRSRDPRAFSYGDIFCSLFSGYLCGGDCIEDVMDIKPFWDRRGGVRIASSDTIERALRKLSERDIPYRSKDGKSYRFNTAEKLNSLMLRLLRVTGQLNPGDCVDLDFDHQLTPAEKKDTLHSYKKAEGYFPGVASVGGIIVGIENRDGNTNVKFHQADTLRNIFRRLTSESGVMVRNFRADCGSFSEDVISFVKGHCEHFYIRAANCQSRRTEFMEHKHWEEVRIGDMDCGVASFKFDSFLAGENLRLVAQRTRARDEDPSAETETLFGTDYVYRCIITNDWANTEKDIIKYYNMRGASERNFDCQNNDFGWAHLPFSFLKENTVFMLVTAMLKNFYLFLLQRIGSTVAGLNLRSRLKRFVRRFVSVPAKWTRSGRQEVLNIYSRRRVYLAL